MTREQLDGNGDSQSKIPFKSKDTRHTIAEPDDAQANVSHAHSSKNIYLLTGADFTLEKADFFGHQQILSGK